MRNYGVSISTCYNCKHSSHETGNCDAEEVRVCGLQYILSSIVDASS